MAQRSTDIMVVGATVYFLPFRVRLPLKFGRETTDQCLCARVHMVVNDRQGRRGDGWGETPLSAAWAWPGNMGYNDRLQLMQTFCLELASAWTDFKICGHPLEVGHAFLEQSLPELSESFNRRHVPPVAMPRLAALVCCSAFDMALHDAYGNLHELPVYETYNARYMNRDLACFLEPAVGSRVDFHGRFPEDYLVRPRADKLPVWHLVGGADAVEPADLNGNEPQDGYPVLLRDWIRSDGLKCLKIKLRGTDAEWDYDRIRRVGNVALEESVAWLSVDFNCTVESADYVNDVLDRLMLEHPCLYGMILYVEQPFPYELAAHQIDVHSVSARKPLFMDESAHDWRLIRRGRELGWTGVALKTCKTQTGALLSLCWAKAHGMALMVQDLTNSMLAQIPHCLLAAHAGTIMGVESNAMQFCPELSRPEAMVHPGLYIRRQGMLDLHSISGPGFGYRLDEIKRELPAPRSDGY